MEGDLVLSLAIAAVLLLTVGTFGFVAYSFLLHLRARRLEARREALEAGWRPRLLAAGTGGDEASAGKDEPPPEVADRDRILFLDLLTEYVRSVQGPERARLEGLAAPYLEALTPLVEDRDPYRRAYGLDLLGELGYEEGRERLARGLEDESGLVAMVAARAFARRGDPEFVPGILARLDAFGNWSASYLASLLAEFGPEACPALRSLAFDAMSPGRLRAVALQALRELNDLEAVHPAARTLPDEREAEVQAEMIRLIGGLGGPEHLASVRAYFASPEPFVRAAAIRAVGALSDRRTSDLEIVARALDDPSPWVALQAAHGLLDLGRRDELILLAGSRSPRAELAAEVLESRP